MFEINDKIWCFKAYIVYLLTYTFFYYGCRECSLVWLQNGSHKECQHHWSF